MCKDRQSNGMADLSGRRKITAREGYMERLIDESRRAQAVGTEVVDNRNGISRELLSTVAAKVSQIEIVQKLCRCGG